jgi:septal ring factor EnvC (AmiA/AmiB activator)
VRCPARRAGIRRALEQLVVVLEAQRLQRDTEILLRRIELKERRLAPLEGRVRDAESEVNGLDSELRRFESMREELEARIDAAIREGADPAGGEDRRMLAEIDAARKGLEGQLDVARQRLRLAEDALAEAREEIELLDDALLELLE